MRVLGSEIEISGDRVTVAGIKWRKARYILNAGNSGTTLRLLAGSLAGIAGIEVKLAGDKSLMNRPMDRVIEPLRLMGADVELLIIRGRQLHGIDYTLPMPSAQVKSAVLLAGLNADGTTTVRESIKTRDHTETMLKAMGADICGTTVKRSSLTATDFDVPGDISSAVFAFVLGAVAGRATVKGLDLNPTRTGCLDVLRAAGARVSDCVTVERDILKPFVIEGDIVPRLIDEIPALAVLACFCEGTTVIKDAAELRVKESNRIQTVADMINSLGGNCTPTADGMIIEGKGYLDGGGIDAKGDHRIAMSGAVALALSCKGGRLIGGECANISYQKFFNLLA